MLNKDKLNEEKYPLHLQKLILNLVIDKIKLILKNIYQQYYSIL